MAGRAGGGRHARVTGAELQDVLNFWERIGDLRGRRLIDVTHDVKQLRQSFIPLPFLPVLKHAGTAPLPPSRRWQEAMNERDPSWWKRVQPKLHRSNHMVRSNRDPHGSAATESLKWYGVSKSDKYIDERGLMWPRRKKR
ncbi:unnamed protein product [Pedinophyceae sp. YPF-701]|nr:unnamed protein product [Pedinophyceae sp. YPF-701]